MILKLPYRECLICDRGIFNGTGDFEIVGFHARWRLSKKRTSVSGLSRLNASAPAGTKNGSLWPRTPAWRPAGAEITLGTWGIARRCWRGQETIKLNLVVAGPFEELSHQVRNISAPEELTKRYSQKVPPSSLHRGGMALFMRQLPSGAHRPGGDGSQFQAFASCKSACCVAIQAAWRHRPVLR